MAEHSVVVGSLGVAGLLLAFALNLFGVLDQQSRLYIWINFVGAALSCWASMLIAYMPFVVLEGAWAVVAAVGLVRSYAGAPSTGDVMNGGTSCRGGAVE